jgi:prophage DNA circulation protein
MDELDLQDAFFIKRTNEIEQRVIARFNDKFAEMQMEINIMKDQIAGINRTIQNIWNDLHSRPR